MASAHVSGVASLVFSANPSLSASQVAVATWFMNGTTIGSVGVIGGLDLAWQVVGMR